MGRIERSEEKNTFLKSRIRDLVKAELIQSKTIKTICNKKGKLVRFGCYRCEDVLGHNQVKRKKKSEKRRWTIKSDLNEFRAGKRMGVLMGRNAKSQRKDRDKY